MTQHLSIVTLTAFLLASASMANAQTALTGKIFINVSGGGQIADKTLTTSQTFPLYDQTASVATVQTVGSGGLFDLSVGYRIRPNIAAAFGFNVLSSGSDLDGAASIPHPLFFNQPRTVEFTEDASRGEQSYYLQGIWFLPLNEKIDVALGLGPSFTHVSQESLASVNVPAGTQDVVPVIQKYTGTAVGVIVSLDATYLFTPRYGAGAFVRYNGGGSTEVAAGQKLKAGGFQMGIGLRLRL